MPNKTSSWVDNTRNKLVKNLSEILIVSLYIIFNRSLMEGIFQDAMKVAAVVPLYKSKEMYLLNNYRSISLLLTLSVMTSYYIKGIIMVYKVFAWIGL